MIKPFNQLIKKDIVSKNYNESEAEDNSTSKPMVVIGVIISLISIVLLLITIRKGFG